LTDDTLTIAVIAGTTRLKRQSIKAARFVAEQGKKLEGVEIIFVDPAEFNLPNDGNDPEGKDPRYSEITAKADAFFVVTPEYNHSFPGSLKRLLDSELENYVHKPVALAGASDGNWGGVRAVEALVTSVREMGLIVTFTSVYFPRVPEMFDEQARLKEEFRERTTKNVNSAYQELIWMARVLKWGRQNLPRAK
jgi:NAD(P)H-dependent FMN reductase